METPPSPAVLLVAELLTWCLMLTPTWIALVRRHEQRPAIITLNLAGILVGKLNSPTVDAVGLLCIVGALVWSLLRARHD